jgi:indolepyruvate ferredoxin oxidoreductase alpha subunit
MKEQVLLGDEAVALAAVHAGLTAAYSYPGTPATEILEFLRAYQHEHQRPLARWTANEKTAFEEALGVSMVGKRALVSMKHVGLNVAADPFMNSALLSIHGGLVVAVADDPGMHSSQNEQDSRFYADFAHVICLEPADQQQAYDMTREAFDLSERFKIPVLLRLVTRLAHSRAVVRLSDPLPERPLVKSPERNGWILLPGNARVQWRKLLDRWPEIEQTVAASRFNVLEDAGADPGMGVITTGIAVNYFNENRRELLNKPLHLHIGAYPLPAAAIRKLAARVSSILVLEDGYPFVERQLRGLLPGPVEIRGKLSGQLPQDGELNPDLVREALGLGRAATREAPLALVKNRPPQLCAGCPHGDTYAALKQVLTEFEVPLVTADIGCYTLGALPPYQAIESCVCMGASVSMAKGAADAGQHPAVAVIGDSTFLHSGVTPLMDAVAANADMTLIILDNSTVGMTGGQDTLLPSKALKDLVLGLGVNPDHCHEIELHARKHDQTAGLIRRELDHRGLSVIIARRECLETAKRKKSKASEVRP